MSKYLKIICCIVVMNLVSLAVLAEVSDQAYFKQFQDVFERIKRDYVQDPDRQKMTDSAINGMLTSLDPHSSYFVDEDLEDFVNQVKGEFGGIGVEVIFDNGAVKIISPIDDLPADKAGIKAGDYIIGVNGELVATLGYNKAIREMRGNPGTTVKLLVVKGDEIKPQEIELTREMVQSKPVKSNLEDGDIAYVRIVTFNNHTFNELKKSMKKLEAEASAGVRGIILDLRNNPGGPLEQAVAVSEYFIDSGAIVSTKGRNGRDNSVATASKFVPKAPNVPIVVLINGGSASASEIVAGALQDYKRGLLVGTKSFGKGSVQTFAEVSPRAAVKLTTAKYYTPSGRSIQGEGIEPDIIIEPAKVEYAEQAGEKRFSEASLKNYLKNDKEKDPLKDPKGGGGESDKKDVKNTKSQEPKKPSELYLKDFQYARAYDLIRGLILTKVK